LRTIGVRKNRLTEETPHSKRSNNNKNTPNPQLIVEGSLLIRIFSELDIGRIIYLNTDITEYIKEFGNHLILSTFGISNIFDNNPFDKTFNKLKDVKKFFLICSF